MPGYRLEITQNNRSKCNGRKPCKGSKLLTGDLRAGTWVEIGGHGSFKWRHWGCVTPDVIRNMKKDFEAASELDGFDELTEEFQAKVNKAWEEGHVDPEDVPETAKKEPTPVEDGEDEGGEPASSPAKKKATPKRKKVENGNGDEKRTPVKPRSKKAKVSESEDELTPPSEEEAPAPKKNRGAATKKALKREELSEDELTSPSEAEAPPPKKNRGTAPKKALKAESNEEELSPASEEEVMPQKKKRGQPVKRVKEEDAVKPTNKRGRKTKAKVEDSE